VWVVDERLPLLGVSGEKKEANTGRTPLFSTIDGILALIIPFASFLQLHLNADSVRQHGARVINSEI
jgi:hypothetical protein